jgi:hypothetical protein
LRLVGYDIEPDVLEPGKDNARLSLFWQVNASPDAQQAVALQSFDVFVHLNAGGAVVQTNNGPLTQVSSALPLLAERLAVEEARVLTPPVETPPSKAHFEVGLYHYRPGVAQDALDRIPIVDDQGNVVADRVDLGPVWIGAPPATASTGDLAALDVLFDNRIQLVGLKVVEDPANRQRLLVDLGWKAVDRSTTDYTAFVHLLDETGQQIIAQHDAPPGGADNPTGLWAPGELVRSTFGLVLPDGVAVSDTSLRIGLYEPVSGKQLPITAAADGSSSRADGTYVVVPVEMFMPAAHP